MSVRATMPATMPAQDEACHCYVLAQELLPERLEAYLNLGNLRRLRMQVAITSTASAFAYEACAIGCATQSHTAKDTGMIPTQTQDKDIAVDGETEIRSGTHRQTRRRAALSLTMCKTLIIALFSASFLARTC
jgi:hypothetical protein